MEPEKTPGKNGRKALVVVGVLGAIAVNIAAFMLSADAINAVAEAAGISKNIAWAMVAAVDGLMVTGTVVFIANKLRGRSVVYPLCVLGSGVLLSIICNALHAKAGGGHVIKLSNNAKMGVSAIPAVSLALSFHLIADMVKDSLGVTVKVSEEAPAYVTDTVPGPVPSVVPGPRESVPQDHDEPVPGPVLATVQDQSQDHDETVLDDTQDRSPKRSQARRGTAKKAPAKGRVTQAEWEERIRQTVADHPGIDLNPSPIATVLNLDAKTRASGGFKRAVTAVRESAAPAQ
jgi:hypothetical protein